jgi:hypothetical protein
MKKFTLFLLILLNFIINANAQTHVVGERQLSLNINLENNAELIYKYYKSVEYCHRFGISEQIISSTKYNQHEAGVEYEYKYLSYNIEISYGIQKSFFISDRLEPYIGLDVVARTSYSNSYSKRMIIDEAVTRSGKNGDYSIETYIEPQNFAIILRPVLGLSFLLSTKFSIGAEYQVPLLSLANSEGGQTTYFNHSLSSLDYTNTLMRDKGATFKSTISGRGYLTVIYSF